MAHNVMPAPSEECQDLYERDYYTWALEQARALKERRLETLDWHNLAEEVEDLGRSEKRELRSRLEVLLVHLLKWRFQPKRRSKSWKATVAVQRLKLRRHLRDNPGLKPFVPDLLAEAYDTARIEVAGRLSTPEESQLPTACPWSFEELIDETFKPEA
ncbi:MAG TPA: DUF29 domain-containing protein [Candidatus Binataceae bacterium]|nr:DUF29 domain-containing protein [Candidatus Binataceae bacterium]